MSERTRTIVYMCPVDHQQNFVFVKGYLAPSSSKKNPPIVLSHDHDDSFEKVTSIAQRLANSGFNTYFYEMRLGNKKNVYNNFKKSSFEVLASDLLQVVAWIKHRESGRKPIVIGHKMGALVTLYFIQGHSKFASGLVLLSPTFFLNKKQTTLQRFFLRLLNRIMPLTKTPNWLIPLRYKKNHKQLSVQFIQEIFIAISKAPKFFLRLNNKTLIIVPNKSKFFRHEQTKRLLVKHRNENQLSLVSLELSREKENSRELIEKAYNEIITWIEKKI